MLLLVMPHLEAVSLSKIARWAGTLLHHIFRLLLFKVLNEKLHPLRKSTHPAQAIQDFVKLSCAIAFCNEIMRICLQVHKGSCIVQVCTCGDWLS